MRYACAVLALALLPLGTQAAGADDPQALSALQALRATHANCRGVVMPLDAAGELPALVGDSLEEDVAAWARGRLLNCRVVEGVALFASPPHDLIPWVSVQQTVWGPSDLSAMVALLGPAAPGYNVPAIGHPNLDFDSDGDIDLNDLSAMVALLGPSAPGYNVPCP